MRLLERIDTRSFNLGLWAISVVLLIVIGVKTRVEVGKRWDGDKRLQYLQEEADANPGIFKVDPSHIDDGTPIRFLEPRGGRRAAAAWAGSATVRIDWTGDPYNFMLEERGTQGTAFICGVVDDFRLLAAAGPPKR